MTLDRSILHRKIFTLPYLGILSLAAVTPPSWEVKIANEHLVPLNFDEPCDLVGITVMTPLAPRAYEIAEAFRRRGKQVVLGGLHPTNVTNEAMENADCVVRGEAKKTWPDLLADAEAGRLQRLYEKRPPFDLAELPLPRRLIVEGKKNPFDAIQATRGCVFQCDFCSVHGFYDRVYRVRPVKHVIRELKELKGRVVCFVDDHLTANREWALELFRAMIPLKKHWMSMASLTIARDDELLRMARRSGCLGFFIGFLDAQLSADQKIAGHAPRDHR